MKKVIFVCSGNTCRSPVAQAVLNDLAQDIKVDIVVESAGLFAGCEPASDYSILVCKEHGLDISDHRSRPLTAEIIDDANYIVPMTHDIYRLIEVYFPFCKEKLLPPFNVSDPFGRDVSEYRKCFEQIKRGCEKLIDELKDKQCNR